MYIGANREVRRVRNGGNRVGSSPVARRRGACGGDRLDTHACIAEPTPGCSTSGRPATRTAGGGGAAAGTITLPSQQGARRTQAARLKSPLLPRFSQITAHPSCQPSCCLQLEAAKSATKSLLVLCCADIDGQSPKTSWRSMNCELEANSRQFLKFFRTSI